MQKRSWSRISQLRKEVSLTQEGLAHLMGVSKVTIQSWEKKPFPAFRMVNFALLFMVLEFEPSEFFNDVLLPKQVEKMESIHEVQDRLLLNRSSQSEQNLILPKIKKKRVQRMTQRDLSTILDVSVNTIQNMENSRTSDRFIVQHIRLCKIFNCCHFELVDYIPEHRLLIVENVVESKFLCPKRIPKILQDIRGQVSRTRVVTKD